jgi:RNA polymerase sigma-54 factor
MLQQKLSQKMLHKLSPQQIQLMKLLQVPTAMLEQRVEEELETNPALEEGADNKEEQLEEPAEEQETDDQIEAAEDMDTYLKEYMDDDPGTYSMNYQQSKQTDDRQPLVPVQKSFHDFLAQQLALLNLQEERKMTIALQIVGSIDDDGYLRRETESIMDDLLFSQNMDVREEEIESLLSEIQQFDPPGVGARNLQECLLIQLKRRLKHEQSEDAIDNDIILLAIKIIKDYFNVFSKKHYKKLLSQLEITEDTLRETLEYILKLNPKPASGMDISSGDSNYFVIPDFIIEQKEGELSMLLNTRNAPDLHVNRSYLSILSDYRNKIRHRKPNTEEKSTIQFIKQKIDSAKWFIEAIKQREHTLYSTMYAMMQLQHEYFMTGDPLKLKPMILKDVADLTGLDVSTISRVVNNKYVQTEFGTKKLKEFFSEALQMEDGSMVSSLEIKNALLEVIEKESKVSPYSDEKLKEMLSQKGYQIARRTVTKYRKQLHIPVARLRKEL